MIKKWHWVLAFSCALFLGQPLLANTANTGKHACPCKKDIIKKLNLSDAQQAQIKAIRAKGNAFSEAKLNELKTIHHQIQELIRNDKLDDAKLNTLLEQKKEINAALIKNRFVVKQEIYNVFDDKQKQEYDAMIRKWREKRSLKQQNKSS